MTPHYMTPDEVAYGLPNSIKAQARQKGLLKNGLYVAPVDEPVGRQRGGYAGLDLPMKQMAVAAPAGGNGREGRKLRKGRKGKGKGKGKKVKCKGGGNGNGRGRKREWDRGEGVVLLCEGQVWK